MNTASESDASSSAKVIGIVTIILGIAALAAPLVVGESMLLFVGLVVTVAGVLRIIWVFRTDSFGRGAWKFLVGVLTLLAGVFILGHPLLASAVFRRNRHRCPDGRQTDFHRIDGVAAGHHPA